MDVLISYMFSQVELAQNMAIYCGIVKLHKVDSTLARNSVDEWRMTRKGFRDQFAKIYGKDISTRLTTYIEQAEKTRDKIMHGKPVNDTDKREAAVKILKYACGLNNFVNGLAGFRPFGNLRGFKGAAKSLDKKTSRWVLKGMDFNF